MSDRVRIKVHNVFHEESDYDLERAEKYIEDYILSSYDVVDVRIASGWKNTPLYLTVDTHSLSVDAAKRIAREGITAFSQFADGVDVDDTIHDNNIRVMTE